MSVRKLIGVAILVLGVLALVYGGFTYTEDRHELEVGPVDLAVEEKEQVNVPVWAGVAAVVVGGVLLAIPERRS
ncbi:MAG: hypothetical protein R3234_11990 [Thermoanaerobaculia bacterium]|nr:hypothetical protein [Thermoanaerobaculia bacterium]